LDDPGDVLLEALLHLRELRFELPDALLLALGPLPAQFLALLFERVTLRRHLLLHAVQFVAAAVEICNQVRGLARLRRQHVPGPLEDFPGKAEPLRDGEAARTSRHA